jgi:hypothetical protein
MTITGPDRIAVLQAESLALGAANASRLTRMMSLIVVGFGGLTGLATALAAAHRFTYVSLGAPLVILLLWMTCIRTLAELYMTSSYRRYFDDQIQSLLGDVDHHGFRSWQQSASRRGAVSWSNITLYSFVGALSIVAIAWSAVQTFALVDTWLAVVLAVVWSVGSIAIAVSALGLRGLSARVRLDLDGS